MCIIAFTIPSRDEKHFAQAFDVSSAGFTPPNSSGFLKPCELTTLGRYETLSLYQNIHFLSAVTSYIPSYVFVTLERYLLAPPDRGALITSSYRWSKVCLSLAAGHLGLHLLRDTILHAAAPLVLLNIRRASSSNITNSLGSSARLSNERRLFSFLALSAILQFFFIISHHFSFSYCLF